VLAKAHALGLRVMIDQVLSHTSIEHAWFAKAASRATTRAPTGTCGPMPQADGTPAQQLAVDLRRRGLALGTAPRPVLPAQLPRLAAGPQLPQPDVQAATLDNVKFWLDRGVDGLRLDAINFCFHDRKLRDNPPKPGGTAHRARLQRGQPVCVPVPLVQQHAAGKPALPRDLRALLDRYPGRDDARRDLLRGFAGDDGRIRRATNACTWATASNC
jgi:alpha-glucosidase